jgi:xanthine dehydrogenase accessory factor
MLVFPDGSQQGTLGGGCVEAEVKRRALQSLVARAAPEIISFCLDEDYGWDDGLICGGRMTMLVDPFGPAGPDLPPSQSPALYYQRFGELVGRGRGCTEAVMLSGEDGSAAGQRYLFDGEGQWAGQLGDRPLPDNVRANLLPLERHPRPYARQGIAYLPCWPRITVLIVGGGHVGQAVARLAADVEFDIWVLDDREGYANRQRFPAASRIMVGDIGTSLAELSRRELEALVYALIVTRGHAHDEEALYQLVTSPVGYVGMIGSKRKIKLIYEDLVAKGIPQEALARVHAPLGLDIGSQTVGEIAISIVAELIAHRNLGTAEPSPRERVRAGNL